MKPCRECGALSANKIYCSPECRGAGRVRDSQSRRDKIRRMQMAGVSLNEIASRMRMAPSSVKRYLETGSTEL